jgi:hypothetical protein
MKDVVRTAETLPEACDLMHAIARGVRGVFLVEVFSSPVRRAAALVDCLKKD